MSEKNLNLAFARHETLLRQRSTDLDQKSTLIVDQVQKNLRPQLKEGKNLSFFHIFSPHLSRI